MRKHIDTINNEIFAPTVTVIQDLPWRHPVLFVKSIYTHFFSDSLYRNSIYLMLSTAIMAFFGFFFWMICTRLYTPEQVGIATILISVAGLISGFSILGLNVGLVRYLSHSDNKNSIINSSFTLNAIITVLLSVIFLLGLNFFSPKLLFLKSNLFYVVSFILFITILSLNNLIESIFIAYRSTKYILLKNSVLSITKLVLPLLLVAFSAYGIFTAVGIANIIAFVLAICLLMYYFKYQPKISINIAAVKKIGTYSFVNYIAGFFGGLPVMLLPLIIINKIGAAEAGYFYIALMIANFLFIIPQATTQSLFAEGSYREEEMREHIKKSVKITTLILLPAILVIIFFGNYILLAFGKSYSIEAFRLLQIMVLSSVFIAINSTCGTILRVRNKIKELIVLGLFINIIILSLTYLFIGSKLFGIGAAWFVSQVVISIIYLYFVLRNKGSYAIPLD